MDINIIMEFISKEALVLIPVLWIIGTFLKLMPKMPDWFIPFILLVVGEVGAILLIGANAQAYIQGVLVTGAAVLGHQLLKQAIYKEK